MDGQRWFSAYRITFYLALIVTTLVRLYFISGFGPEFARRVPFLTGSGRGFDLNLWLGRIGSAAFLLTLAAAAAVVVSLAARAYTTLLEGSQGS